MTRRADRAGLGIAALLLVVGAVLVREGAVLPAAGGYAGVGAGDIPRLIGWGLVGLAAWTAVEAVRAPASPRPDRQEPGPVLWITGGLAAQLLLLGVAGFSIATGLLFAATARAFGQRRLAVTVPVGILLALAVYGVFDRLLQLNLPAGLPERLAYGG